MADISTTEPTEIPSGSTVQWRREDLTDYPASAGWALSYALVKSGLLITITAAADVDAFAVTLAATATALYAPGEYHWQAYVTKGAERFTVDSGTLKITPNFSAASTGYDARSVAQIAVEAIDAVLAETATLEQKSYALEGRSLDRRGLDELWDLRNKYMRIWRQEQAAEKAANGLGIGRKILTRFV